MANNPNEYPERPYFVWAMLASIPIGFLQMIGVLSGGAEKFFGAYICWGIPALVLYMAFQQFGVDVAFKAMNYLGKKTGQSVDFKQIDFAKFRKDTEWEAAIWSALIAIFPAIGLFSVVYGWD